jgi:hypothetical protein
MWVDPADDDLNYDDPDILSRRIIPDRRLDSPHDNSTSAATRGRTRRYQASRELYDLPQPLSPYQSAMSGLNRQRAELSREHHIDNTSFTPSGNRATTRTILPSRHTRENSIEVAITPHHDRSIAVVVTPRSGNRGHQEEPEDGTPISGWEDSSPRRTD